MLAKEDFGPIYVVETPDFPLHPLCTAFPRASDTDIDEMCRITRQIGGIINDPAIVWDVGGVKHILDGGNRQFVAKMCGVPLEVRDFLSTDYSKARTFVILKNLGRRHMTGTQRAAAILEVSKIDKANGYSTTNLRKSVAEQAQVSESTVRKVQAVDKRSGSGALHRLASGETTLREELGTEEGDPTGRAMTDEGRPDTVGDILTDDDGAQVPDRLMDVWNFRPKFPEAKRKVKEVLDLVRDVIRHPAGHGVSVEHEKHLKDLAADLDAKMPALSCCHCDGTGVSSSDLSNRRWVMMGKAEHKGKCYICQGRGYLLKDEPRPGAEWMPGKQSA